jgi:hypothetical protein
MNDREVYSKTESGREEMRTRALQLSGAIRNVLLLVDGKRTLAQIKTLIAGGKAPPDALEQLLRQGLIELTEAPHSRSAESSGQSRSAESSGQSRSASAVPPSMPIVEPEAEKEIHRSADAQDDQTQARFNRLYTLMNELVSDYLGLRGYFMQLKIEKCANADELLALQPELSAALIKAQGKEVGAELAARIESAAR